MTVATVTVATDKKKPRVSLLEPSNLERLAEAIQTKRCPLLSNVEESYHKVACVLACD